MAPKILAFAGSSRRDSYNKKVLAIAVKGAEEAGAKVHLIDLKDYPMPLYNQDLEEEEGLPENAKRLKALMLDCDGFLIASPEYNSSITPLLKNVIDWTSRAETKEEPSLQCFKGKVAALMSASPGALGGMRSLTHLRSLLQNIQVLVLPVTKSISKAYETFDSNNTLVDEKQQQAVKNLGKELAEFIAKAK